jgi:hypothetical protein
MWEEKADNFRDRRVFERFNVRLPVKFIDLRRKKEGTAYTRDICAKGLGLIASEEINPYTPIEVWLEVPDKGQPLYTRGEVVWSSPAAAGTWRMGINLDRADLMGVSRVLRATKGIVA